MKKVVITGPTGAIGTALIWHLIKNNIEVLAVCRKNSKKLKNIPKHPLVRILELNLDELHQLPEHVKEKEYDIFYHFAWDGTFGDARNNMSGQVCNIQYTLDAVRAASLMGCKRFIGAGSQAEYGRVEGCLTPMTPTFPENGYGMAKLAAGQMSRILCRQLGMEHIWTRILSVYGPCDGAGTMVMSTIHKLLNGEKTAFTKGEQMWDYLYAKDAGKAMYILAEKGKDGKVYCLGSGKAMPLKEYIEIIKNTINEKLKLEYGEIPYASNQVMHLCADITELEKDTGFCPEYGFENGIVETIEWYKRGMI